MEILTERNKKIGRFLGTVIGRGVRAVLYIQAKDLYGISGVIAVKTVSKYGVKTIKTISKNYVRTNFSEESIFEDFLDANLNAF